MTLDVIAEHYAGQHVRCEWDDRDRADDVFGGLGGGALVTLERYIDKRYVRDSEVVARVHVGDELRVEYSEHHLPDRVAGDHAPGKGQFELEILATKHGDHEFNRLGCPEFKLLNKETRGAELTETVSFREDGDDQEYDAPAIDATEKFGEREEREIAWRRVFIGQSQREVADELDAGKGTISKVMAAYRETNTGQLERSLIDEFDGVVEPYAED